METKKNKLLTNKFFVAVSALICCALWGSATPFIKVGYELILPVQTTASTILFAGIRFLIAGILTVLIYSIARRKILYPKKENWGRIAVVSCSQTIIQYMLFFIGLANTSGVKGTIISGSNAFFAMLVACLIFRQEKITFKKVIACIIGFAGIVVVNLNGLDFNMTLTGEGFVLFSSISYAFSSAFMKKYSSYEDPVIISGYQFILGGAVMMIIGFVLGGEVVLATAKAVAVLIYLAFVSAIAYSLWGVLLKFNPVSKVTIYTFTTPVFGVLLSAVMLTEQSNVTPVNLLITLVLVCTGILILNYKKDDAAK